MLSRASIARQPWPAELIVPSVYCCSLGPASAGNGTPNALFWPLAEADADAAADGAAAEAAADGAATDAAADGAATDGAVEAAAGAHASSTAGAAITPPT